MSHVTSGIPSFNESQYAKQNPTGEIQIFLSLSSLSLQAVVALRFSTMDEKNEKSSLELIKFL